MAFLLAGWVCATAPAGGESVQSPFGLKKTNQLPTESLRMSRRAMLEKGMLGPVQLRDLADRGDGLAAFYLARQLEAAADPRRATDAAHYYAIAVHTGRVFATPRLIRTLDVATGPGMPAVGARRLATIRDALEFAARHGQSEAAMRLARAAQEGTPFGAANPAKASEWAKLAFAQGETDGAEFLLRQSIARGDAGGMAAAADLALSKGDLRTYAMAQNLLRMMDKGEAQ